MIEQLLEERRKASFWAALEAEAPDEEYRDQLAEADSAFLPDAEEAIGQFEGIEQFESAE